MIKSLSLLAGSSITDQIAKWAIKVMEQLGGPGAAFLIALENVFPPLPSEVILPLAGFTASKGSLNFFAAIIWTTFGSLVGALLLYQLGKWLGRDRIRHYAAKLPLMKVSDINKAEDWFTKHENKAVLFGRMIPIVRSLISIPAGVEKMPIKLFIVYTTIGSLVWNTSLITAGYVLGEQWTLVERYVGVLQYLVIAIVLILVARFVFVRLQKIKTKKSAS
jgi:membrane protein DedA with SNARE-associated domain